MEGVGRWAVLLIFPENHGSPSGFVIQSLLLAKRKSTPVAEILSLVESLRHQSTHLPESSASPTVGRMLV